MTKPVRAFVQPNSRILSKAKGSADSLEAELKASNQGCAIALKNPIIGIFAINMIGIKTIIKNMTKEA